MGRFSKFTSVSVTIYAISMHLRQLKSIPFVAAIIKEGQEVAADRSGCKHMKRARADSRVIEAGGFGGWEA